MTVMSLDLCLVNLDGSLTAAPSPTASPSENRIGCMYGQKNQNQNMCAYQAIPGTGEGKKKTETKDEESSNIA